MEILPQHRLWRDYDFSCEFSPVRWVSFSGIGIWSKGRFFGIWKSRECLQSRWWFQIFFLSSLLFGEDSHFDSYFSDGLKPPTSNNISFEGIIFLITNYSKDFATINCCLINLSCRKVFLRSEDLQKPRCFGSLGSKKRLNNYAFWPFWAGELTCPFQRWIVTLTLEVQVGH